MAILKSLKLMIYFLLSYLFATWHAGCDNCTLIMDNFVNHYSVLGLPSGDEGAKLSEKEISKAYKLKALELHPDKRPDDPNAQANFQNLKTSYEVLKDENARKLFDEFLKAKQEKIRQQSVQGTKRQKMMVDLEKREQAACAPDLDAQARKEEERIAKKLRGEINSVRERHRPRAATTKSEAEGVKKERANTGAALDKERVLKVSWENLREGYSAERLRELFSRFGEVEDVVIRSNKKKASALVVMSSKDAAVAATKTVCGDLSNPLLVVPLQREAAMEFPTAEKSAETENLSNLVGAGYQAFEDSVLEKLQKVARSQK